jgi:TPR repeat protein
MRHYAKLFRATLTTLLVLVAIDTAAIASTFTEGFEAWQRGDYAESVKRYREGAEQGDAAAQHGLAGAYYFGWGVPKNYAEAAKWFGKAAEQGDAASQYALGGMYVAGKGVARDYAKAAKWYRKSAEQGDAEAQRYLGSMYYSGNGVLKDDAEAVKWWRRAAEQGLADAQYILGTHYFGGEVLPRDYVEAYKWLNLAASGFTHSDERETRDKVIKFRDLLAAEKMTPDQIAEAQRLTREWKPKPER